VPGKAPHIAVSVDMLDTGIDIPEVVNLVFFKIVRSKTKFWQMIGRGTRLCPNLFGPDQHKEHFYVFDFCQNFEFFNQNPELAEGGGPESLGKRLFLSRVELVVTIDKLPEPPGEDRPAQGRWETAGTIRALRRETVETLRSEVAAMNIHNFIVRPKRRCVEKYADAEAWVELPPDKQHELAEEVAGLPSEKVDEDVAAKQFDLLVLRTQLALLRADIEYPQYKARIMEIASALEELDNIPTVRAEMALIQEIQTDEFWQDVTAPSWSMSASACARW
jgi:type I restriction enzyme R subunit